MPAASGPIIASAVSAAGSADHAAGEVCERAAADLERRGARATGLDLVLAFASGTHTPMIEPLAATLRRTLDPARLLVVPAPTVLGGREAFENRTALSLLACRLPGVSTHPLPPDALSHAPEDTLAAMMGDPGARRGTLLFADPSSTAFASMLPRLGRIHQMSSWGEAPPIVGALTPGDGESETAIVLDDAPYARGAVGLSIAGDIRLDVMTSLGCQPFGEPMLVTRAKNNLILELGGRPAVEAIRDAATGLSHAQRALLPGGLYLGIVADEYKPRFGRGDFLIRRLRAVDENSGAVAVEELMSVGRTVQLHLRDAQIADDDLALLLDAQALHERPLGALLLCSGGRGSDFFGDAAHDPAAVQRAFRDELPGERKAKGGEELDPASPLLPLAGLFSAAEIAPAAGLPRVHTHAAVLTMFRRRDPDSITGADT